MTPEEEKKLLTSSAELEKLVGRLSLRSQDATKLIWCIIFILLLLTGGSFYTTYTLGESIKALQLSADSTKVEIDTLHKSITAFNIGSDSLTRKLNELTHEKGPKSAKFPTTK